MPSSRILLSLRRPSLSQQMRPTYQAGSCNHFNGFCVISVAWCHGPELIGNDTAKAATTCCYLLDEIRKCLSPCCRCCLIPDPLHLLAIPCMLHQMQETWSTRMGTAWSSPKCKRLASKDPGWTTSGKPDLCCGCHRRASDIWMSSFPGSSKAADSLIHMCHLAKHCLLIGSH